MPPTGLPVCFTDVTFFCKCRPCHSTTGGRIATRIDAFMVPNRYSQGQLYTKGLGVARILGGVVYPLPRPFLFHSLPILSRPLFLHSLFPYPLRIFPFPLPL